MKLVYPWSHGKLSDRSTASTDASESPDGPVTRTRSQTIDAAKPTSVSVVIAGPAAQSGMRDTRAAVTRWPLQFGSASQRTV